MTAILCINLFQQDDLHTCGGLSVIPPYAPTERSPLSASTQQTQRNANNKQNKAGVSPIVASVRIFHI